MGAALIRQCQPGFVPGPLQTSGYARLGIPGDIIADVTVGDCLEFSAVRDAFIYLETSIPPLDCQEITWSHCFSARRVPTDGFMGHLTRGGLGGVYSYVKGAFLLFRNATAHRSILYTAAEAEDIIHVVDLCLRMPPARRAIA